MLCAASLCCVGSCTSRVNTDRHTVRISYDLLTRFCWAFVSPLMGPRELLTRFSWDSVDVLHTPVEYL